jgi:hypothetical protein
MTYDDFLSTLGTVLIGVIFFWVLVAKLTHDYAVFRTPYRVTELQEQVTQLQAELRAVRDKEEGKQKVQ